METDEMSGVQLPEIMADRLPLVYGAVFVVVASMAAQYLLKADPLAGLPFPGEGLNSTAKRREAFMVKATSLYADGYRRFKDRIFRVSTPIMNSVVVIPGRFLDELKKLPDDMMSFDNFAEDDMFAEHTKIVINDDRIPYVVKANLTPALSKLNPGLTEEVVHAMREVMPPCRDWTPVHIIPKLTHMVAMISGRVFVGPEMCRDPGYIDAAVNYTVEVITAREAILKVHPWLRWLRAPMLPEVKVLKKREEQLLATLGPSLRERLEAQRNDPGNMGHHDLSQWMIDASAKGMGPNGGAVPTDREITNFQLGVSFAAIHTTSTTAANTLYDLIANPSVIPELREEASAALAANGGVFTSAALQGMKKLDSCIKESLRLSPPSLTTFRRKVLKPFTLSNGQVFLPGTMIEVPSHAMAYDPELFPDPEKWDGLRFYRIRESGQSIDGDASGKMSSVAANATNQLVSVSQRSIPFGYGRHACPGRFFAANEIKMILARFLLEYDVKIEDGATERYRNIETAGHLSPDPTRIILFKEVK